MQDYSVEMFGACAAEHYDDRLISSREADSNLIDFVVRAAGTGARVVELGCGTGRIAVPLAQAGLDVVGVDVSPEMLDQARERAAAAGVDVEWVAADATVELPGRQVDVVVCVFNTLFMVGDQDAQVRMFALVARALRAGGLLVVECLNPDETMLSGRVGQALRIRAMTSDTLVLMARQVDCTRQRADVHEVVLRNGSVEIVPHVMWFRTPAQMDESAARAGLAVREERADWDGTPFTPEAGRRIVVYALGT